MRSARLHPLHRLHRLHRLHAAAAVAALASLLAPAAARADVDELVATQCKACHGADGNSVVGAFPRLAGQQPAYLEKQLRDFLSRKRRNDAMNAVLATVKDADVPGLAAHFATQRPTPNRPDDEARVAAGKAVFDDGNVATGVPACVGCHQPGALGNARYPRLAGQHPAYAAAQLKMFKTGERSNDRAKVMRTVAERMSDDEIAAVVEYLATLP